MDINKELVRFNQNELPENFVSIAVQIDENKIPCHAAILIRHRTIDYLHHFPGKTPPVVVDNFKEDEWYIYKIHDSFNFEDESEIGSFLHYCQKICSQSRITYSYITDGSYYTKQGEFISKTGLPELGTCVGFCINTFSNTLIDLETSMFELDDWDDSEIITWIDNWSKSEALKKYPDIDWSLYNAFKKRITPLDYICSSFIKTYPIKKAEIDGVKPLVLEDIESKF